MRPSVIRRGLQAVGELLVQRKLASLIVCSSGGTDDQHLPKIRIEYGTVVGISNSEELAIILIRRDALMVSLRSDVGSLGQPVSGKQMFDADVPSVRAPAGKAWTETVRNTDRRRDRGAR